MKTLDDVKQDMSNLYDSLKSGETKREDAAELANIAGKFIRADALQLAHHMFEHELRSATATIRPQRRISSPSRAKRLVRDNQDTQ